MDIYFHNVHYSATRYSLIRAIANILHSPAYEPPSRLPLNFHVQLFINGKGGRHKGNGLLTLPTVELGAQFLKEYGDPTPSKTLVLGGRKVKFSKSHKDPNTGTVEQIRNLPYLDPKVVEDRERRAARLQSTDVALKRLQFGWECRDNVFSSELEYRFDRSHGSGHGTCLLRFDDERRAVCITLPGRRIIVIRFSQIQWFSASMSITHLPIIFFSLYTPPAFELATPGKHQRLMALDSMHSRVVSYTSLAIRLVCVAEADLASFKQLSRVAQLQNLSDVDYPVEDRGLFSIHVLEELKKWLCVLDWATAFQVEALVRSLVVDAKEMLSLRPRLTRVIDAKGTKYAASFLLHFANRASALLWDWSESEDIRPTIEQCFISSEKEYVIISRSPPPKSSDGVFDCIRATITPTTMILEGPFPERSNRVIRSYPDHHDCFLRVSFADEDRLQFRFDRNIDGPAFTKLRVGSALLQGLRIAGRYFRFLAYSQSSLKEHAVWFVKDFSDLRNGRQVSASTIIESLGTFRNLPYDPKLIYCPARYGARVSQAFTSTDASTSVEVEEVFFLRDIENESWCFTDGVGTISRDLARDIKKELQAATRRRARRARANPRAFQVRFMGSKGMLSVDYTLSGRAICLRDSMIKFSALESREIEIARAFDSPGKYYLNRPLIMILEHLGVPCHVFQKLQDEVVRDAQESLLDLERAAGLLEAHGLGNSFRMTSVMLNLKKLGVSSPDDQFYHQMMEFAVHHVLRELKQRARIPVPGAYTLVGIADVHQFLNPREIFACIKSSNSSAIVYLEGPILISRSPTIHPGDVQIVHARGRPPPGSCFEHEPLQNTVVFATKGDRPIPSCLGGGDLDGDLYNLIPLDQHPSFTPNRVYSPGEYPPAPKKFLDRPSTMDDVADFFVEYINSDVIGIVAKNWLIIADQSPRGIDDPDCTTLSRIHSDAVDYPKSGQPVSLSAIPRLKFQIKPDWDMPETVNPGSASYYKSPRAIGHLFRSIHLPALRSVQRVRRQQLREQQESLEDLLGNFHLQDDTQDPIWTAVEARISEFIPTNPDHETIQDVSHLFSRYTSELQTICMAHTLSYGRSAMLTEEEAVIGTIVAKSSQPRRRRDVMAKMREVTEQLVRHLREELEGGEDSTLEGSLERAWAAWQLSVIKRDHFGAKSFGWLALGAIFEAIKDLEDE